jgi:hypothetical protein
VVGRAAPAEREGIPYATFAQTSGPVAQLARSGIMPTYQKRSDTVAYVETAKTSQMSGLRKFGHMSMASDRG